MKLTTAIVVLGMAAGTAWAQNVDEIQNARDTMKAVQQKKAIDSNAALAATQGQAAKPASTASANAAVAGKPAAKQAKPKAAGSKAQKPKETVVVENNAAAAAPAKEEKPKTINLTGRRDPFVSPVVSQSMVGSGCSTGKRCLAVDQITLKGVVKADTGMIAVVVNAMEKAYFLRENDPIFNGYVVRITGDSVVFKESIRDRLGKPLTREVTKKIITPAV